jgi:hypothetical protein
MGHIIFLSHPGFFLSFVVIYKAMKYLMAILFFLLCFEGWGQAGKKYQVNPGQKIFDVIPRDEVYKYPEFTEGVVYLRGGTFGRARLNYNSLFGEMQFIDPKGDTLSLADEKNISRIFVNKDTFYYEDGCIELLTNYGKIKLAAKRIFSFSDRKKAGGLNQSGSGEIETFTTFSSRQSFKDLTITETLTFTKRIVYYFGDEYNHFILASKKSLLKMFGEHNNQISEYLNQNKINFKSEEDLKKLCSFLKTL